MDYLKIAFPTRTSGSYYRKEYIGDLLDRKYRHNGAEITFSRRASKIKDPLTEELLGRCKAVIFALLQPEYFSLLKADLEKAAGERYLLTGEPGDLLPAPPSAKNSLRRSAPIAILLMLLPQPMPL